ncbi:hypothetical protein KBI23_01225 [bacterium]|nr:hypothetical protein [bacterium]MBP9808872.1 hypothetical protein [bacterium]
MRIFIPTEYADIARNLHHMIWREIEERQIHFSELQFSGYELCKAQPRREFSRISLCGRDQKTIEEVALKNLCDFDWPEPPFIEKAGKIDVWQRPADKPAPANQPGEVESPYGQISSMIDTPVETSKYFHAIGFASFVWSEVFQPAIKQRNETGEWPLLDDELASALTAVFDSASISQAAQSLGTPICDWRDRTITAKPEQEQAGGGMVNALSLLGKVLGNSAMEQVSESMIMRTGVAGEIDPFYLWSFYVATDLWRANVQPACFQRFCDLHYSNLYAADHFNVCRMADLLPEVVYGENVEKDCLRRQINNLARLLKETSQLATSGEGLFCHSFGAEAAPILAGYSVAMADLAKRI